MFLRHWDVLILIILCLIIMFMTINQYNFCTSLNTDSNNIYYKSNKLISDTCSIVTSEGKHSVFSSTIDGYYILLSRFNSKT